MIFKLEFRRFVKFFIALVIVFLAVLKGKVNAQISAKNASYQTSTEYTSTANDPVYVFCDDIGSGAGELRADSPDGTSGWTFRWTRWVQGAGDFTQVVTTESNQSFSILSNLEDGRYRVIISKSGEVDVISIAWVLNNSNTNPVLSLNLKDCAGVHLLGAFTKKELQYQDVPGVNQLNVQADDKVIFSLQRNGEEKFRATLVNYDGSDKNIIDQEAYEGEEVYQLVVVDQYGCEFASDLLSLDTYAIKANFSVDPEKGEAPLDVNITNLSVNSTDYEWYLYQDYDRIETGVASVVDSLLTDAILRDKDLTPYTYQHPGRYFIKLIVKSDKGSELCSDELILTTPIDVEASLVQVPNVFTPDGDGRNDVWLIKSQSLYLESFRAIVLNRWGRVVYESKNSEDGWDGKVNGKMATPGTYFYVITAVGREEKTKKYTKKGSFMLIRK